MPRSKRSPDGSADPTPKAGSGRSRTRQPSPAGPGTGKALVIVESPTKARTIRNYLPDHYRVEASMGHIRDLPPSADEVPKELKGKRWANLGVNTEAGFEPLYVIPEEKKKVVRSLQEALREADELILATDEDREGESISWHLREVLQPRVPTRRMVFHEITREAIQRALLERRDIDEQLVRAQETRRILDRLVGYTLSPLLWKKIAANLSAGRVQSVAVRVLVERERQRRAFRSGQYWNLRAELTHLEQPFEARLHAIQGTRLATGSDFDPATGQIVAGRPVRQLDEAAAETLVARLRDQVWQVANLEERQVTRRPAPPFTTSTLQQEANRKLRLSARETMRTAQGLYERGFITYMRTDSVHLSQQAIDAARACVEQMYGREYLSPQARQATTKTKGAQEAHEAIRPAGATFQLPQETGLAGRDLALYDLIWKRTVASQMAEARQTQLTVHLQVADCEFRASGRRIDFPGYLRAYVEGSDDPEAALENREVILPPLALGDEPDCLTLTAQGHETQPPDRYTEASLVKTLESEGIGRPSTYATIIGTIVDRGYAQLVNHTLVPTFTGFAVTQLLEQNFPDLVDTQFTARMEQTLDDISTGEVDWLPYLEQFYLGEGGLESQVKQRDGQIDPEQARTIQFEGLDAQIHIGRYGPYIEVHQGEETLRASLPADLPPADLDWPQVETLLKQKTHGPDKLGIDPETQLPISLLVGQYGPYVQLGEVTAENPKPKRASLPKGLAPNQVTLETALGLLALPRTLGEHPEGGKVQAGLGRFGPYVVHSRGSEKQFRSLKSEDDVLTVTLERALALLAEPKAGRGRSASMPLRELGGHPEDGEPVNLYKGPYGFYVKHGTVNAGLTEAQDPETLTLEQALELLSAKQVSGGRKTKSKASGTGKSKAQTSSKPKGKRPAGRGPRNA
ncbi:MAG: type I DNA topoisomerase [Gloeomargaritaceae cyanobacterium C42_A2020_066]|nr:type I DNA topoisomerase [Gloeomargaritaceae cyanobacterium C42_A2020_066]